MKPKRPLNTLPLTFRVARMDIPKHTTWNVYCDPFFAKPIAIFYCKELAAAYVSRLNANAQRPEIKKSLKTLKVRICKSHP